MAAGQGLVADEIIRRAEPGGIVVIEDVPLAAILSRPNVGEVIPPELYAVVGAVRTYIYRLDAWVARRFWSVRLLSSPIVLDRSARARYGSREMRRGW